MLRETITYEDYNGVSRTESFYFNLTKTELMMLESSVDGGLKNMLEKIVESKDVNALIRMFKKIVHISYGQKSDDGKRFIKSEEISNEFEQTLAYDKFFMDLVSDADKASQFVNAIIPKGLNAIESVSSAEQN